MNDRQLSLFGFGHQSHLSIPLYQGESQLKNISSNFDAPYKTILTLFTGI